eukprot:403333082
MVENFNLRKSSNFYHQTYQGLNTSDFQTRPSPQITDRSPFKNSQPQYQDQIENNFTSQQKIVQNQNYKQLPMQLRGNSSTTSKSSNQQSLTYLKYNQHSNFQNVNTLIGNAGHQNRNSFNLPQTSMNINKVTENQNQVRALTQKGSTNQFALPIIGKKSSISDADVQVKSLPQNDKIQVQWSPLPSANSKLQGIDNYTLPSSSKINTSDYSRALLASNNLSPRGGVLLQNKMALPFGIQEKDEFAEETNSDEKLQLNGERSFEEEEEIIDWQYQNGHDLNPYQLNSNEQMLQSNLINTSIQSTTNNNLPVTADQTDNTPQIKNRNSFRKDDYSNSNYQSNQSNRNSINYRKTTQQNSNVLIKSHVRAETLREVNPILDVSERSRKSNTQMTEVKQQAVTKALNQSRTSNKKQSIPILNTQDILFNNQFNPNGENQVVQVPIKKVTTKIQSKNPVQKLNKKLTQQQKREDDIKKYFQANMNSQLHFTGTEYSTPGASSKFLDEYQLEEKSLLGIGGYAEVRLAIHKKSGHKVAIKIYEKYKLIDPQVKQNLIREIKVLNKLDHPNIMKLYESIDTLSNVYLINEYIQGMPLNDYMKTLDPQRMDEVDAIFILKQLIDSIQYLHQRNICHRDIKLENIIINPASKEIKLIDFGFAVFSTKPLKLYCGTPSYMAPEIILKKEYRGAPVDIWTCGVAFYVMICGNFPFSAHTDRELSRKIQGGIYHLPKELSQQSIRILQKMLATDPNNRGSAQELMNDLIDQNQLDTLTVPNTQRIEGVQGMSLIQDNDFKESTSQIQFEKHLDNGRGKNFQRSKAQFSPRTNLNNGHSTINSGKGLNLDNDTFQHLLKLGYLEDDIKLKYNKENEMIGILYKRLLTLKSQKTVD